VDDLARRVLEDVARRQHRPVIVDVDGVDGLERFEADLGSIRFHWRDGTPAAP
jgi:hypothetical protein